jgi:hypothetical protein
MWPFDQEPVPEKQGNAGIGAIVRLSLKQLTEGRLGGTGEAEIAIRLDIEKNEVSARFAKADARAQSKGHGDRSTKRGARR